TFCGLDIPTFAQRAARLKLTRRHLLQSSKNQSIRDLWEETKSHNALADSLLDHNNFNLTSATLRDSQTLESLNHFLGLKSQGIMSKLVNDTVPPRNITLLKQILDGFPDHIFNFFRKAMMRSASNVA